MARPSQGIDQALLRAGVEEIERSGVRGLSVRAVCARAGASIRMLNYHFGSKDNFVRQVLTHSYEQFFHTVQVSSTGESPPLQRLRRAFQASTLYMVEHRNMARRLWMDANAGEPLVLESIGRDAPKGNKLLLDLLREAQERGALRSDIPVVQIFTAILPGVIFPCLWHDLLEPYLKHLLPPEALLPPPDDPVEIAMRNFDCLLEGFKTPATALEKGG